MNDILENFASIFSDSESFNRLQFKEKEIDFYFHQLENANSRLLTVLNDLGFQYSIVGNIVTVDRKSSTKDIVFYASYEQLFKAIFENEDLKENTLIVIDNNNVNYYYYDPNTKAESTNFMLDADDISIMNNYTLYASLLKLFQKSENVIEFNDTVKRRLLIVDNGKEKNFASFNYQIFEKRIFSKSVVFDFDYLSGRINSGYNSNNTEWLSSFKHNLVSLISSQNESNKTFTEIFLNISFIISNTERDYEIYISGFSFEKISKELKQEKQNYFTELNQAQDKIKGQVIAVPLSIGTSIYAFFQIKTDHITLYFILGMILIYIGFIWWFLSLYEKDLRRLKAEIVDDSGKFEALYPKIYDLFKSDFQFIKDKIESVLLFSYVVKGVIILDWLALAVYVIFFFQEVNLEPSINPHFA